jgi:hypothetical protein
LHWIKRRGQPLHTLTSITASGTVQDVTIAYAPFLIVNNSADQIVYIKSKDDGVAATTSNAFGIPAKTICPFELTCATLSVIASGSAAVQIMTTGIG